MKRDPWHCYDCDRRLDGPPPADWDRRLRLCRDCQADVDAYAAALGDLDAQPPSQFRGVIALGVPLPAWPTDITLLALEVWDRFSELSFVEIPGSNPAERHPRARSSPLGDQPPHKWVITTDIGTVHHNGDGGGGTPGTDRLLLWHTTIAPSLPEHARTLDVHAHAPGATAHTTVDLSHRPITRRPAATEHHATTGDTDPGCPSCGTAPPHSPPSNHAGGFELDWAIPVPPEPGPSSCILPDPRPLCAACRSTQQAVFAAKVPTGPAPDRVLPVGAQLGPLFDAQLAIPALVIWPSWFDLTIVGHHHGAWGQALRTPNRAIRWTAHDDRGHHYLGATTSASSGRGLARKNLSFTPTLAPDVTALTLVFPASLNGQAIEATIDLAARSNQRCGGSVPAHLSSGP